MVYPIKDAFIKNASYHCPLGDDLFVGSFHGRIILGRLEYDEQHQLQFEPKSIPLPCDKFFELVSALRKGLISYKAGSQTEFAETIYQIPGTKYFMMATFDDWPKGSQDFQFQLRYKWIHSEDKKFQAKVLAGKSSPVQSENPVWSFVKRGYVLHLDQLTALYDQMQTVLEHTFFDDEGVKQKFEGFIVYTLSDKDNRMKLQEHLQSYDLLSFNDKILFITELVTQMVSRGGTDAGIEPHVSDAFQVRKYMDILRNKIMLIYSLFNYHILKDEGGATAVPQ